jgi:chemotaxis protein CheX
LHQLSEESDGGRNVDVRYVNPFVEGIDRVFQTMLGVEPKRCPAKLSSGSADDSALTSLVDISGQLQGVVVLRFPPGTALRLAGRMLGTEIGEVNAEVVDAISEIVNMVAGSAKAKLGCDPPLKLGLPTVVQGADYRLKYPSGLTWLEVPFESAAGEFALGLTFQPN